MIRRLGTRGSYHRRWTGERDEQNLVRLRGFGDALPALRAQEARDRQPQASTLASERVQRCFEARKSGVCPSILSIAQEQRLATKEVTRIVYLAFLAPDLVERIASGTQPAGLGTKRLLAMAPLPLSRGRQAPWSFGGAAVRSSNRGDPHAPD